MGWLDVFKSNRTCECLICGKTSKKAEATTFKYRYGDGEGKIGTAFMCSACDKKYNSNKKDEDYVEPI